LRRAQQCRRQYRIRSALLDAPQERDAERQQRKAWPNAQRQQARGRRAGVDLAEPHDRRREHDRQQHAAEHVEPARFSARALRQNTRSTNHQRNRRGNVDDEQPPPARLEQQPTEQRAEQKRHAEDGADEPERPAAPLERHGLGNDRRGYRQQTARAERLDRAADEERRERPRASREQRADGEHGEALEKHAAASVAIRALCEQRSADEVEQHVNAEYRGQPARRNGERTANRGQRRTDDRDVESGQQDADEQHGQRGPLASRRHLVRPQQEAANRIAEERGGGGVTVIDSQQLHGRPSDDFQRVLRAAVAQEIGSLGGEQEVE
jgi:hypothetical protein